MKFQRTFSVLIPSVIAAAMLAGHLQAAVVFAIQDAGPALNTSTPPIFISGTGTVGSTIASTTFTGGLSNLSIGFTQMQNGGWGTSDSVKLTYASGNVTLTSSTYSSNTYNFPDITNFFTMETLAQGLNLQ